jgi:hypothetical protein
VIFAAKFSSSLPLHLAVSPTLDAAAAAAFFFTVFDVMD